MKTLKKNANNPGKNRHMKRWAELCAVDAATEPDDKSSTVISSQFVKSERSLARRYNLSNYGDIYNLQVLSSGDTLLYKLTRDEYLHLFSKIKQ